MSDVARRLVVRGRVQGVGYRHAAVQAAAESGVTAGCAIARDGTRRGVRRRASPAAVEAFAAWCRRGPPLARVTEVDERGRAPDPDVRFERR